MPLLGSAQEEGKIKTRRGEPRQKGVEKKIQMKKDGAATGFQAVRLADSSYVAERCMILNCAGLAFVRTRMRSPRT